MSRICFKIHQEKEMCGRERNEKEIGKALIIVQDLCRKFIRLFSLRKKYSLVSLSSEND